MSAEAFERYRKMQEKFRLPRLDDLMETFKFEINNNERIFDEIRDEISERIFTFTEKIIESVIAGPDSFSCIFEQNMITDEEKERLFVLYKKIQALKWENNLLLVRPDEKQAAEWIKKAWDLWNTDLEIELSKMCRKLSVSWRDLKFGVEKTNYHG